jgi:hypothetical protein
LCRGQLLLFVACRSEVDDGSGELCAESIELRGDRTEVGDRLLAVVRARLEELERGEGIGGRGEAHHPHRRARSSLHVQLHRLGLEPALDLSALIDARLVVVADPFLLVLGVPELGVGCFQGDGCLFEVCPGPLIGVVRVLGIGTGRVDL